MSRDFPEIFVLRHGETEWNAQGRMQGWLDSPLTARGRAQAARQADTLTTLGMFERGDEVQFFVSPLGRTQQTADIALPGVTPNPDDRLREISVGDWEGQVLSDLKARHPERFREEDPLYWYDHAPGGEGYGALEYRCAMFLDELKAPAVIVTHGITSRMLRCLALGLSRDRLGELPGGQGVVHSVQNQIAFTYG